MKTINWYTVGEFERAATFSPAFDKRHSDPKKNYGIGSVTLSFYLRGHKGVTQFVVFTGMHLRHVAMELAQKAAKYPNDMGADLGGHSETEQYEGQMCMEDCHVTHSGKCYYDGSGLQAQELYEKFTAEGEDVVWQTLEDRYHLWFNEVSP